MNAELFERLTNVSYTTRPVSELERSQAAYDEVELKRKRWVAHLRFRRSQYGQPNAMSARWGVYIIT